MKAKNLVEMVSRTVERFPDKDAFLWKNQGSYQGITYAAFWEKVRLVAAGLAHFGITKNDKVAILSENNPNWPISDLAIMSLGAVSVPIHSTLPPDQISYILNNADCKFIFVQDEEHLSKLKENRSMRISMAVYDSLQTLSETDIVLSLDYLMLQGSKNPFPNWEGTFNDITRDDLATIIHTSGTTGAPKGAMLTHGNLLSNVEGVQFWVLEARPTDILLSHLPLSHVFERMAGQFMPLSVGSTIAYAEGIDKVQQNLLEIRPTVLISVPLLFEKVYTQALKIIESGTPLRRKIFNWAVQIGLKRYEYYLNHTFDEMLRKGVIPKEIKTSWKLANKLVYSKVRKNLGGRIRGLISGGGALNPEIAKFFWAVDIPVLEGYGLTETSPVICVNPMSRSKVGTVGKPLPNLDIHIAKDGEVLIKGPSVMKGYYQDEEATAAQFKDGWFLTGDIGALDEDGFLKIIDRKKRIIVLTTGKNVAPQPVENAINQSIYIGNSLLVGQNKKYVIALITPSIETLIPWAKRKGLTGEPSEIIKSKEVHRFLSKEVERFTQHFAKHEQPKKILIADREWTVEGGELTPSLKVRIPEIEKRYRDVIERAYSEGNGSALMPAANEIAAGLTLSNSEGRRKK
ncbi:AMP-dependent synthetase/ligase [Neobacillus terrae]|uniref:AMP-dependent synthetase/ligase n=1 Tax=Neobacillus terrae TaxID=3034837 RepID=UPI0014083583|nr:long-chain fatty acid--CoA ligase [Neobacillus terrae]NHM29235.1 long-chain fatty acid--CoA ligase [Neobacillus terrae]